jgi:hypothetical protein
MSRSPYKEREKRAKRGGRKVLKFTIELGEKIATHVRMGMYAAHACALCGVSRHTYNDWKNRGRDGEEPYVEFYDSLMRAEAEALFGLEQKLYVIGSGNDEVYAKAKMNPKLAETALKALTFKMARRFPKLYGEAREHEPSLRLAQQLKFEAQDREAKAEAERGGGSERTEIVITTRGAPATVSVSQEKPKTE